MYREVLKREPKHPEVGSAVMELRKRIKASLGNSGFRKLFQMDHSGYDRVPLWRVLIRTEIPIVPTYAFDLDGNGINDTVGYSIPKQRFTKKGE